MKIRTSDNNRIAKNTLLLYVKMLYSLVISLYTSRVILAALGFEDYGLYNVIGSIVSMFIFLQSAMGNSINRFITFELGKEDFKKLNQIFSMSLIIHIGLAILIVILCETVGIWFLNTQIDIPKGREVEANWVFQFSIISIALSVISVPYYAEIIAHERMVIFAVVQIFNSTLNLGIAYAVTYKSNNRLFFYALLLTIVQVLNLVVYKIYCKKNFLETKFIFVINRSVLKEITRFAGWSLIGNLAYVSYTQGLNILLNIFFGPAVNAARGIAVNVQSAVSGFVKNFQMALNPQIIKSYSQEDYVRLHSLIYSSSKLSYYLLYCLILPIVIESKAILEIWLGNIPDYAVIFTVLTLTITLVDPLSNPLGVANNATGHNKQYQIIEGCSLLLILPISYISLKIWGTPISIFVVQLLILYLVQIIRLFLVCHKIKMSKKEYFYKVLLRVGMVTIFSAIIPLGLYHFMIDSFKTTLIVIFSSVFFVLFFSYFIGLDEKEKNITKKKVENILRIVLKHL